MAILTAEETFSVADAVSTTTESVTISVISAPVAPNGTGRLTHPTFGTYDYEIAPAEWDGIDQDILIPPVWQHEKTLSGGTSTLWQGYMRDVNVAERWLGTYAMRAPQFRMLLDMWRNPPSAPSYVIWTPNYTTTYSYQVQLVSLTVGGTSSITMDYTVLQGDGFIKGPVELTYKVIDYFGT